MQFLVLMSNFNDVNDGREEAFIKLIGGCIMQPIMLHKNGMDAIIVTVQVGCGVFAAGRMHLLHARRRRAQPWKSSAIQPRCNMQYFKARL